MAGLDIIKQAGKSVIGMLEKAQITIKDGRRAEKIQIKNNSDGSSSSLHIDDSYYGSFLNDSVDVFKNAIQLEVALTETTDKKFIVRFNPSELSINAVGGGKVAKTNFDGTASSVQYTEMCTNIQLMVRLVFDDMDINDSFMNENLNPLNPVRNVGKKVYKAASGKRNSVQAQVEGFIAALRNSYTRRVEFNWGTLSYKGVLNYMNSEYTMFSIQGRPVRANVDIGMLCSEPDDRSQWENKYAAAFSSSGSTNMESLGQNVGNFLNINL